MRVLVTGCFDIIHPGHIFLFKKAAEMGEVYVIVARDSTIEKWKHQCPVIPEAQRLEVVKAIRYVTHATLGNENKDFMKKALELKPDLILLGPNQKISVGALKQQLLQHKAQYVKVARITEFYDKFPLKSSTEIKQKILSQQNPDEHCDEG